MYEIARRRHPRGERVHVHSASPANRARPAAARSHLPLPSRPSRSQSLIERSLDLCCSVSLSHCGRAFCLHLTL